MRNVGTGDGREFLAQGVKDAGHTELRQRSRDGQLQQKHLFYLAAPVLLGPSSQRPAADEARLVVIRAKISCPGVRDLDRNDGNIRAQKLRSDNRRNALVGL